MRPELGNVSSVPRLYPNLDKSLNGYSSLQFITDLSVTNIDETIDIDPQTNEVRIRKFVLCVLAMSRFGQIFESLLLTELTMDLSDTHSDESMDISPQSNMA